jgi:anthranilate synthase component 2
MKVCIIDNYDSFTYNLAHLLKELKVEVNVFRNDQFQIQSLEEFDSIVLSPGPGVPKEAGLLMEVIRTYAGKKPILGVCLGEQAIGEVFGAKLSNLTQVFHGIQSKIKIIADDPIFKNLPSEIAVGRYHSWVVDTENLPECLQITAISEEGYIMALRHKTYDVCGIQFHPESILTPEGKTMISNWMELI